jgi:hypothetical protein
LVVAGCVVDGDQLAVRTASPFMVVLNCPGRQQASTASTRSTAPAPNDDTQPATTRTGRHVVGLQPRVPARITGCGWRCRDSPAPNHASHRRGDRRSRTGARCSGTVVVWCRRRRRRLCGSAAPDARCRGQVLVGRRRATRLFRRRRGRVDGPAACWCTQTTQGRRRPFLETSAHSEQSTPGRIWLCIEQINTPTAEITPRPNADAEG